MRYSLRRTLSLDSVDGGTHNPTINAKQYGSWLCFGIRADKLPSVHKKMIIPEWSLALIGNASGRTVEEREKSFSHDFNCVCRSSKARDNLSSFVISMRTDQDRCISCAPFYAGFLIRKNAHPNVPAVVLPDLNRSGRPVVVGEG